MRKSAIVLASLFLLGATWAQKTDTPASPDSTKSESASKAPDAAKPANPPSVETRKYKGTLVDANCAANVTQKSPEAKTESNAADRDASQSCTVTSSTKEFAMRTKEGRVLRFDDVGNQRAADALKNEKRWSAAVSGGKAINVTVGGSSLDGDHLTVITIN